MICLCTFWSLCTWFITQLIKTTTQSQFPIVAQSLSTCRGLCRTQLKNLLYSNYIQTSSLRVQHFKLHPNELAPWSLWVGVSHKPQSLVQLLSDDSNSLIMIIRLQQCSSSWPVFHFDSVFIEHRKLKHRVLCMGPVERSVFSLMSHWAETEKAADWPRKGFQRVWGSRELHNHRAYISWSAKTNNPPEQKDFFSWLGSCIDQFKKHQFLIT